MGGIGRPSVNKMGEKKGEKEERRPTPLKKSLKINLPYWSRLLDNSFPVYLFSDC